MWLHCPIRLGIGNRYVLVFSPPHPPLYRRIQLVAHPMLHRFTVVGRPMVRICARPVVHQPYNHAVSWPGGAEEAWRPQYLVPQSTTGWLNGWTSLPHEVKEDVVGVLGCRAKDDAVLQREGTLRRLMPRCHPCRTSSRDWVWKSAWGTVRPAQNRTCS